MELISLCLSDIPKEQITTGKNGKRYCNIVVSPRKQADKYGNDLTVYMGQSKGDREAKKEKTYIGSGKTKNFEQKPENKPVELVDQTGDNDDLPF